MGIKLVIVDDAPFMREVVRNIVSKSAIQVVGEACDGEEAVAIVLKKKPDVVLMDIIMPKKSGLEAAKEILSQLPGMRIIACSTESNEEMVMQAIESGCCSFLSKPFKSEELLNVIESSVQG